MPTFSFYDRERLRERKHFKISHKGNFVTLRKGGFILAYDFGETPAHYKTYEPYRLFSPHPVGYIFEVPPPPRPTVIGTWIKEEEFVPTTEIPVTPPIVPPEQRGWTTFKAGMTGVLTPGTTSKRIVDTEYPIAQVLLLADPSNSSNIWVAYKTDAVAGACFKLVPGAARLFPIDDLSDISIVAENDTDKVYYIVETPT